MKKIKYVALLRGIGPGNPNMHNDKLRGVFESLGLENVQSVISSGNVLFESPSRDVSLIETMIEEAFPRQLGFTSTTIIRSLKELEQIIALQPFGESKHDQTTYLTVTFLKHEPPEKIGSAKSPENDAYKIVAFTDRAICSITDLTSGKGTQLMAWLERHYGKQITTRTWKTVERIVKRMK
jgi:uncharacterized protein (DUF1697 family)